MHQEYPRHVLLSETPSAPTKPRVIGMPTADFDAPRGLRNAAIAGAILWLLFLAVL